MSERGAALAVLRYHWGGRRGYYDISVTDAGWTAIPRRGPAGALIAATAPELRQMIWRDHFLRHGSRPLAETG